MQFLDKIYRQAKLVKKRILLPEGEDVRVLRAVDSILKQGLCYPGLLGDSKRIAKIAKGEGIDLKGVEIIDSSSYGKLDEYAALFCEIRKHKKMEPTRPLARGSCGRNTERPEHIRGLKTTVLGRECIKPDDARKLIVENPSFYSALAVRSGDFDGFVAGASTTTRDVAKAAIYCIGPADDMPTISSSSIVILPDKSLGSNGVFIFADTGIIPDPTAEQLRDIAISATKMARLLLDDEPRVAMLSYSTKGSGGIGKSMQKVERATELVIQKYPELLIDGEVQLDCAIVPEVSKRKDPASRIRGRANVFIFPNLDAGNISYKLAERLAKARAIGPILQGLKNPASDLSRGCGVQDIVDAVSVVALIAAERVRV